MRFRIYFAGQEAVEVEAFDVRVIGSRRLTAQPDSSGATRTVDLAFGLPFERISDDHDRTIYRR